MSAYRLYTVIPRLLDLVLDLTNWYIRFNRTRLKGAGGVEDTKAALTTLYESLFTLCLTLVGHSSPISADCSPPSHLSLRKSSTSHCVPPHLNHKGTRTCARYTFCHSHQCEPSTTIPSLSGKLSDSRQSSI